jgi:membrane protein YqaA with SNARE-associated domain
VGVVPHEPVLLYFSKFYLPLTVALVAIAGTTITELLNYSVFKYVMDLNVFKNLSRKKSVLKLVNLFKKLPFVALLVAGFTPVPFYPFRFLVVLAKYPKWKYILAVIFSRTPRYYLLAIFGYSLKVPDYLLVSLFALLVLIPYFPLVKKLFKKIFKKNHAS